MGGSGLRCQRCCLVLDAHGQCPDCALREPVFERVVAAVDYAPPADLLIHYLKSGRRFTCAGMLASLLADAVRQAPFVLPRNVVLVPVPASKASLLERGFNPAAEIARALGVQLDVACRPGLLQRAQEGVRQTRLTRSERARSVLSLYRCPVRLDGAVIAVVDDVMTTGNTMHSIAQEFKAAGAEQVYGLVVARTPVGRGGVSSAQAHNTRYATRHLERQGDKNV
ncbi:ComF family protein [Alcaligenaceae bacterium]|nr:ComF family protein [Alcaligenaceae bacterium]